jgi:hypothetical protein
MRGIQSRPIQVFVDSYYVRSRPQFGMSVLHGNRVAFNPVRSAGVGPRNPVRLVSKQQSIAQLSVSQMCCPKTSVIVNGAW